MRTCVKCGRTVPDVERLPAAPESDPAATAAAGPADAVHTVVVLGRPLTYCQRCAVSLDPDEAVAIVMGELEAEVAQASRALRGREGQQG